MTGDEDALADADNWEVARGADGDGWRNVVTGTNLGVLPSEGGEGWELVTDNHVLGGYGSKDEARAAALEWMLDHPRPVNI